MTRKRTRSKGMKTTEQVYTENMMDEDLERLKAEAEVIEVDEDAFEEFKSVLDDSTKTVRSSEGDIPMEAISDAFKELAAEVLSDPIKMVGPFEVRLNDVYDAEGRSVARCGYVHNTRVSGPPMAEVVCAALNRYHGKR